MFRIRKISDAHLPVNQDALNQIFQIIREQFSTIKEDKIQEIKQQLFDPVLFRFSTIVLVAEDSRQNVKAFALLLVMTDLKFCFLDYIAVKAGRTSSGVGGAMYERIREEVLMHECVGLFMECLPDEPHLCIDSTVLEQNKSRLAFYERYGARPIINTDYETTVNEGEDCPPFLVFDDLGSGNTIENEPAKKIFRAILERKYSDYCPEWYIAKVIGSIKDNPLQLRDYRYIKKIKKTEAYPLAIKDKIVLIINDRHHIHHIKEVGYVESPVRIKSITKELDKTDMFLPATARSYPESFITAVHNKKYVTYFKEVCKNLPPNKSIYPYVFPIRNSKRPPKDLSVLAGYYCIDTFTPINRNAHLAASGAVNCTLTGADFLLEGRHSVYALVRPPGHHAESEVFGGFCYFNSAAIAANYLSKFGTVAILDIDYHHGNGQQQIFYQRNDVFTVSIHGNPSFAYPYFSGFNEEKGEEAGVGFNLNFPLKEELSGEEYRVVLHKAINTIHKFNPAFLVVCLGLDTAKGDPTGSWSLLASDFKLNGQLIAGINRPTLFVQEGGYKNRSLGINARNFFEGYSMGLHQIKNGNLSTYKKNNKTIKLHK